MRNSSLIVALSGILSLTTACAIQGRGPVRKEVRTEDTRKEKAKAEAKQEAKEEKKGIVERVRERIGLGGCDLDVVTKSPGAVGDPCRTSADVMKEEGLSDKQIDQVNRYAAQLEARGGTRQAH